MLYHRHIPQRYSCDSRRSPAWQRVDLMGEHGGEGVVGSGGGVGERAANILNRY